MEWNDSYCIGIKQIDEQHKVLFTITSCLQDAIKKGKGERMVAQTFKELINYTNYHFASEEHEMESASFIEVSVHKEFHKKLISKIKDALLGIRAGKKYNSIMLLRFLNTWLIDHILEKDRVFAAFIKGMAANVEHKTMSGSMFLRKNLKKLKELHQSKQIETDIFISEKLNVITMYVNSLEHWTEKDIREFCDLLKLFERDRLITDSEMSDVVLLLKNKADIKAILCEMPEENAKQFRVYLEENGVLELESD